MKTAKTGARAAAIAAALIAVLAALAAPICKSPGGGGAYASSFWRQTPAEGIWSAEAPIAGSDGETLRLLKIDMNSYTAEIMTSGSRGRRALSIRDMTIGSGLSAGINASYFDEDYRPLGYLRTRGGVVNDYIAEPIIYSGVIQLANGGLSIVHRSDFSRAGASEAVQIGPRLISGGVRTRGLENTIDYRKRARRAGIGTDDRGNAILAVTSAGSTANWKQMTDTMLSLKHAGIRAFINLDGGSSAQIYAESGGRAIMDERGVAVPVGIGFRKRARAGLR